MANLWHLIAMPTYTPFWQLANLCPSFTELTYKIFEQMTNLWHHVAMPTYKLFWQLANLWPLVTVCHKTCLICPKKPKRNSTWKGSWKLWKFRIVFLFRNYFTDYYSFSDFFLINFLIFLQCENEYFFV